MNSTPRKSISVIDQRRTTTLLDKKESIDAGDKYSKKNGKNQEDYILYLPV